MKKENAELLIDGAKKLDIALNREQVEKFDLFLSQLISWNKRINLTAITEEREVIIRHFLDSLTCFKVEKVRNCVSLIDIGSGAGFPGIPLAIVRDVPYLALLESSKKKAEFLNATLVALHIPGKVLLGRAEEVGHTKERETYEVAVARAVASLPVLCEYGLPFARVGGVFIAQKSKKVAAELGPAKKAIKILGGAEPEIMQVEVPYMTAQRYLIAIKKISATPKRYPRRPGIPQKRPLGKNEK